MKLKLPYIVSLRGSDVPFYNSRFFLLDKLFFKRLSQIIWEKSYRTVANSKQLKELALESSPKQNIQIIPNGVDIENFRPCKKKKSCSQLKLLAVGRLIARKGFEYLVNAMKKIQNVSLTIVGDGPLKARLQNMATGLPVHFTGYIHHDQMPEIYRSHDLFILPSLNEGMSNTALEAMASGLPVILTMTGGTTELLEEGFNGFVISKHSETDIVNKILEYSNNKSLLKIHGKNALTIAETKSWKNVAHQYHDMYKEAANSSM